MSKIGTIIVAAGSGTRMNSVIPKQFLMLAGAPVLVHTVRTFFATYPDADVAVVVGRDRAEYWRTLAAEYGVPRHKIVIGGSTRFDSVVCGLSALDSDCTVIAVHDGARPLVSGALIRRVCDAAARFGAAVPVVEVVDSYRSVASGISHVVDRSALRIVQTPQAFGAGLLRRAYGSARSVQNFTDDASVVEFIGGKITLVAGERQNIKLTSDVDMTIAEALIGKVR